MPWWAWILAGLGASLLASISFCAGAVFAACKDWDAAEREQHGQRCELAERRRRAPARARWWGAVLLLAGALAGGDCATAARAQIVGGPVRILYQSGTVIESWSDCAHGATLRALPDSLRRRIEAGDEGPLALELPNAGWCYLHAACDSVGTFLQMPCDGSGRYPSPSGLVRHYWIEGRYLVAVRELESDGEQCLQVVPLWRPSPSPSYCAP